MGWGGHQDWCQRGAQIRPSPKCWQGAERGGRLIFAKGWSSLETRGASVELSGVVRGMVCSGGEGWGGLGAGLVDPPPGMTGLGEGLPKPKVIVSLFPWQRTPLNREPGRGGWGGSSQVPGSGDRGRNRDQEEKQRERKGDLSL